MILLMIIPASFASENDDSLLQNQSTDDSGIVVSVSGDEGDFTDYYFDASAEVDGNGTSESPYKYLNSDRILKNSNIHLANGEYNINEDIKTNFVNFIGSDVDKTVISYNNTHGFHLYDCA